MLELKPSAGGAPYPGQVRAAVLYPGLKRAAATDMRGQYAQVSSYEGQVRAAVFLRGASTRRHRLTRGYNAQWAALSGASRRESFSTRGQCAHLERLWCPLIGRGGPRYFCLRAYRPRVTNSAGDGAHSSARDGRSRNQHATYSTLVGARAWGAGTGCAARGAGTVAGAGRAARSIHHPAPALKRQHPAAPRKGTAGCWGEAEVMSC